MQAAYNTPPPDGTWQSTRGQKTKKAFVEITAGDQKFERHDLELGLSDGIFVEVKSGVTKEDKIKVWNQMQGVPKYAQ